MPGPTTRVLALLELLQSHGRLSGAEISERLGVDRRTVRRYITVLEDLGIPVTTEQGRYGGYMLVAGFKLPPMMFTDEEAQVISLGLLAVRESQLLETGTAVDSVQAKLQRVMPPALKQRVRAIHDNIRLVLKDSPGTELRSVMLAMTDAAHQRLSISMHYESREGESVQRDIDPYGLVFRWGRWYVSGWCHLRQDMRTFRLDRVSNISTLAEHFERPAGFNAAQYLNDSMKNAWQKFEVSVLLHASLEQANAHLCDMSGMFEKHENGLLMNTTTDSYHWFAWWLMQLPFDFTIQGPEELKQAMHGHVLRLQVSYSDKEAVVG